MSESTGATVLIVEDDEAIALLERRALERRGFRVLVADSSESALEMLRAQNVDLIVMDYRLSEAVTGLELIARIKSLGLDLPVIMVTGFSDAATAIEALRFGVRDFVPKSTQYLDYLPDAVARVLKAVHTERQLSESEARFKSFMDNSPAIAFIKDGQGRLIYANRRLIQELAQSDWHGKTNDELWPAETAAQFNDRDAATLATLEPLQCHEAVTTAAGTVQHWLTCRFPLADSREARLIGGMAVDVTQQRAAEEALRAVDQQLRHSQKMEAIGRLAGSVAHDFNNLLTVILGYSDVLGDMPLPITDEQREMLGEIRAAAQRAANLTGQLLAFSRRQILEPKLITLNDVVHNMERMCRRLIGADIAVHTALDPDPEPIFADPGQIEQIMMNLVINARDAMPQGGELGIETTRVELDESYAETHADVVPGRYVMLAISDSGCGMDEETKARIFEPFFTTKSPGQGTGLGLATVYGIVRQSGGHIWVYSEKGHGATFKICFPVAAADGPSPPAELPQHELVGTETILLVEDEEGVRALTRSLLDSLGYTVLEAASPLEAMHLVQSHGSSIDLLLTDIVMPDLNGRRLAELVLSERPQLPVLYMSGYTNDSITRQGILERGVNFVQKPFTRALLGRKVREALDAAAPGSPVDVRRAPPAPLDGSEAGAGDLGPYSPQGS